MSEEWRKDARCREIGPEMFFAEYKGDSMSHAKWACRDCLVRQECGEFAITQHMEFGVWGGMSPQERREEQARRNKERRTAA